MIARAGIVVALLVAVGGFTSLRGDVESPVARDPLGTLPLQLADWRGVDAAPFADDVLSTLGVDDYVNRQYARTDGPPLGVYVGYYASQRQGDTIHSPENCLPGAGWRPVEATRTELHVVGRTLPVNRFVIQKGLDRQVVFYWYQGRGRVVANEYANKAWLMFDAMRMHRTNGGLVRLIAPVFTTTDAAERELTSFAAALVSRLDAYLP